MLTLSRHGLCKCYSYHFIKLQPHSSTVHRVCDCFAGWLMRYASSTSPQSTPSISLGPAPISSAPASTSAEKAWLHWNWFPGPTSAKARMPSSSRLSQALFLNHQVAQPLRRPAANRRAPPTPQQPAKRQAVALPLPVPSLQRDRPLEDSKSVHPAAPTPGTTTSSLLCKSSVTRVPFSIRPQLHLWEKIYTLHKVPS